MQNDLSGNILQDISNITQTYLNNNLLTFYKHDFNEKLITHIKGNLDCSFSDKKKPTRLEGDLLCCGVRSTCFVVAGNGRHLCSGYE